MHKIKTLSTELHIGNDLSSKKGHNEKHEYRQLFLGKEIQTFKTLNKPMFIEQALSQAFL